MCLGIPGRVVRMLDGYGDQLALVDVAGEHRKVNVGMMPDETFRSRLRPPFSIWSRTRVRFAPALQTSR